MKLKSLVSSPIKTFGSSMSPLLQDGDVLYLKKERFLKTQVSDIITVKKKRLYFTHRVIYKNHSYAITKGDNNLSSDGKIYPKNIVGIVYKVKRDLPAGRQVFGIDDLYLMHSTFYFQEIVKVKRTLEKARINFLILKGLPLHLYFEGKHPRRLYADCDLLLKRNNSLQARAIFKKLGYKEVDSSLSSFQKKIKDKESEVSYYKILNDFPIVFDVHLEVVFMMTQLGKLDTLYSQKLIDRLTHTFLREKRVIQIQHENFPILSIENLFIYLALHLFHHNFQGAFRYELIKTLISKKHLDYAQIKRTIENYKLKNFVYPCILLLKKHYNIPFPINFLNNTSLDKNILQFIKKNILSVNIFDDEGRMTSGVERFKNLFYLSPRPLFIRSLVFLNLQVIYAIFWILYKILSLQINNIKQWI